MGQAREVMDRVTEAIVTQKDFKVAEECYAENAVLISPDQGEIRGREGVIDYLREFMDAFPDSRFESLHKYESGDTAIDEGWFVGTNAAPLPLPTGGTIPATGKQVRLRNCDFATVEDGHIVEHRFYFDQMDFLEQLGITSEKLS
ncbi:MAG: nuclear transport factor 2 family protein [Longispora sp.]|nr:nuclear transport factor 2 family protein [Longispora sp. (in: high G+C Gram-positive bacteria)]